VPDAWLTVDHFVDELSAMSQPTRPTQPSIPQRSVNVITWITGVKTLKWQTGAAYGCSVAGQSLWAQAFL